MGRERSGLCVGRRIFVRLPGKEDEWLFVTHAAEPPPFVWVVLAKRVEQPKRERVRRSESRAGRRRNSEPESHRPDRGPGAAQLHRDGRVGVGPE